MTDTRAALIGVSLAVGIVVVAFVASWPGSREASRRAIIAKADALCDEAASYGHINQTLWACGEAARIKDEVALLP